MKNNTLTVKRPASEENYSGAENTCNRRDSIAYFQGFSISPTTEISMLSRLTQIAARKLISVSRALDRLLKESLIKERMDSVLNDDQITDARKESFVSALRENSYKCAQQANRSYLGFLGLSAAFTLIISAQVNKVTILGIDFSTDNLAILLLPSAASFFLYRASCLNQLGSIIDRALEHYYELKGKSIATEKLHELLRFPSIAEAEYALYKVAKRSNLAEKSGLLWLAMLSVFLLLTPILWFSAMIWWLFAVSNFNTSWKVLTAATILLFGVRAIWVMIQTWAYAREDPTAYEAHSRE